MAQDSFKLKSLEDLRKDFQSTDFEVLEPLVPQKSEEAAKLDTIFKQKENLQKRLEAVGVTPDNLSKSTVDNRNVVESLLNLEPDQNFFFDVLEVLDRPARALFSGARAAVAGDPVLEEAWKTFKGENKEEAYLSDLLDDLDILNKNSLNPVQKFAVDLAGDVILDPLNLLPNGFIMKRLGLIGDIDYKAVDTKKLLDEAAGASEGLLQKAAVQEGFEKGVKNIDQGFVIEYEAVVNGKVVKRKTRIYDQKTMENLVKNTEDASNKAIKLDKNGNIVLDSQGLPELDPKKLPQSGELYEIYGVDALRRLLNNAGFDGVKITKFKTNVGATPDIGFFLEKTIDGKVYYLQFAELEVKGVQQLGKSLKEVAFLGNTIHLSPDGSSVSINFSKELSEELSGDLLFELKKALNLDQVFEGTETLQDIVTQIQTTQKTLEPYLDNGGLILPQIRKLLGGPSLSQSQLYKYLTSTTYNNLTNKNDFVQKVTQEIATNLQKRGFTQVTTGRIKQVAEILYDSRKNALNAIRSNLGYGIKTRNISEALKSTFNIDYDAKIKKFKDLIKNILKQKYAQDEFILYVDELRNTHLIKSDELIDQLDIPKLSLRQQQSQGKVAAYLEFRFGSTKPIDQIGGMSNIDRLIQQNVFTDKKTVVGEFLNKLIDRSNVLNDVLNPIDITATSTPKLVGKVKETPIIQMLGTIAKDTDNIFAVPAKFAKDALIKLSYAFDATAGMSDLFVDELKRIRGPLEFELQRSLSRSNAIEKTLKKLDPQAGYYLQLLIRQGYSPEDILSGSIKSVNPTSDVRAILDYYFDRRAVGRLSKDGYLPLEAFANDVDVKNAVRNIEEYLKAQNITDVDVIIVRTKDGKGSAFKLQSNVIDVDEIPSLLVKNPIVSKDYLKIYYGKRQISDDAFDFIIQNSEAYAELVEEYYSTSAKILKDLGVDNLSSEVIENLGYYRHVLTNEGADAFKESAPIVKSIYARGSSKIFAPQLYPVGPDALNSFLREFDKLDYDTISADGFESLRDLIASTQKVTDDNLVLGAILEQSLGLDEFGNSRGFFEVIDNTTSAAQDYGSGYQIIADDLKTLMPKAFGNLSEKSLKQWDSYMGKIGWEKGKALAVNKSVYNILTGIENGFQQIPEFIKYYDSFLNFWKSTTLITPGFHVRNFFGNLSNMYIGGMGTEEILKYQTRSVMDFQNYIKYKDILIKEGAENVPESVRASVLRVQDYYNAGLGQTRKGIRDIEKMENILLKGYDPTDPTYKRLYNELVKANFTVAEYLDDIQRYAMYNWASDIDSGSKFASELKGEISKLKNQNFDDNLIENFVKSQARNKVKEALFDYTNLTSFEKNVMKRIFPFYTFMKNNLIFQAKSLVNNPVAFRRLGKFYEMWNEELGGISREDMPEYIQDNMWLALPIRVTQDDEEAINFLKLNLPASDFGEIVSQPFKRGVSSLAVPIKLPIEFAFMRDSFTDQPLMSYPGERRRLDPEEGSLAYVRDDRGNLAISGNPVIQKLINESGLRVPMNYMSVAFDVLDGILGYQTFGETATDISSRFALTSTQKVNDLELTRLYQDLSQLRELRELWEQQTGENLPTLDELGIGN